MLPDAPPYIKWDEEVARQLTDHNNRLQRLERLEHGGWTLINSAVLAAPAVVAFANIPNTYAHLKIIGYLRDNAAPIGTDVLMRFNLDVGPNYDIYREVETGAGVRVRATTFATNQMDIASITGGGSNANEFSSLECLIPHYANVANHKISQTYSARKQTNIAASINLIYAVAIWRSIVAINNVSFLNTFAIGSRLDLYGIS